MRPYTHHRWPRYAASLCVALVLHLCSRGSLDPLLAACPQEPEIKIAAAADLKFALTEIAAAYEKQSGVKVSLTFGSSGNFFAQIQNGAPFDLFFSADSDYPRTLEETGLIVPGSP